MTRKSTLSWQILPLLVFLGLWEGCSRGSREFAFYFGSPLQIWFDFYAGMASGSLIIDILITSGEAVAGFIVGNAVGTGLGLGLWYFPTLFRLMKPYIVALGSAPVFALAPLMIIWFGTGFLSKVVMAGVSTVFVALLQAHTGAREVQPEYLRLMSSLAASRFVVFRKVVLPSALVWVISGLRLNVGFALLGAFIGEFISSNAGIGHLIIVATGLFDISKVLMGVLSLVMIALVLTWIIGRIQKPIRKWLVKML